MTYPRSRNVAERAEEVGIQHEPEQEPKEVVAGKHNRRELQMSILAGELREELELDPDNKLDDRADCQANEAEVLSESHDGC